MREHQRRWSASRTSVNPCNWSLSSTSSIRMACLLLAVVAIGVGAATVAVVDGAGGGHVEGAKVVVAGPLAVELARAEVDVRGAVAVHPRLGLKAVGAGIAGVEGDGLEKGEHGDGLQTRLVDLK
jgi:hypothetical protein